MIHHLIYVDVTGEIRTIRVPKGTGNPPEGPDPLTGFTVIHYMSAIDDLGSFIDFHYWDSDAEEFVARGPAPNQYSTWNGTEWVWDSARVLEDIRGERDRRLTECDWTQLPDTVLNQTQVTAWRTYRTALRNIPQNLGTIPNNVALVVWPTPPAS